MLNIDSARLYHQEISSYKLNRRSCIFVKKHTNIKSNKQRKIVSILCLIIHQEIMPRVYENSPRSGCYEELTKDVSLDSRLQRSVYCDKKMVSTDRDSNGNVLRILNGDVRWGDYFDAGYQSKTVEPNPRLEYVSGKKVESIEKTASKPHQDLGIHSAIVTSQSQMTNSCKQLVLGHKGVASKKAQSMQGSSGGSNFDLNCSHSESSNSSEQLISRPTDCTSKKAQLIEKSSGGPVFGLNSSTVYPHSDLINNTRARINWDKMKGAIRIRNWKTKIMSSADSNDIFEHREVEMSGLKKESVAMGSVVIETMDDEGILNADDCIEAFPEDLPESEEILVISRSFEHNPNAVRNWRKVQSSLSRIAEEESGVSERVSDSDRSMTGEDNTEESSFEAEEEERIISGVRRKQITFRHNFEENNKLHYMTEESYVETDECIEALPETRSSLGDVLFVSRSFEYNPSGRRKSTKLNEEIFGEQQEGTFGEDSEDICSSIQAVKTGMRRKSTAVMTVNGSGKADSSEDRLLEKTSESDNVFPKAASVKSGIRRKSVAIMAFNDATKERPGDNANNEERNHDKDSFEEGAIESGVGRTNVGVITGESIEEDNLKENVAVEEELYDMNQHEGSTKISAGPEEPKALKAGTLVDNKKNADVDQIGAADANRKQSFGKNAMDDFEKSHFIYLVPKSKDFEQNRSFTKQFLLNDGFGAGDIEAIMRETENANGNEVEEANFSENGNGKGGSGCPDFTGEVNTTGPDFRNEQQQGRRATLEDASVLQMESSTDVSLYESQGLGYDGDYDDDDQDDNLKFYGTCDADFVENKELPNLQEADEQHQQTMLKYHASRLGEDMDSKNIPAIDSLPSPQIYSFSTKSQERFFGVKQSRVMSSEMHEESHKSFSAPKSVITKLIDLKIELPSHVKIIKVSEKQGALQTTLVSYV